MKPRLLRCGSAHCRGPVHRWLDEGTEFARLSSENCGATNIGHRTEEELRRADEDAKEVIKKILERAKHNEHKEPA